MGSGYLRFAGVLVWAGCLCWSLSADQDTTTDSTARPFAGPSELVDVELVTVDVWVSENSGHPKVGLSAGDFEVFHDNQAVPISHFAEVRNGIEIGSGEVEKNTGDDPSTPIDSFVVIYFDQSRLHPRDFPALLRSLEAFLAAEHVKPQNVLVMRQEQSLFVEAAFGSSRSELDSAFARTAERAASGIGLEAETEQALQAIRDTWEQSQDSVGSGATGLASIPGANGSAGVGGSSGAGGPRAVVGGVGSGAGPDACGMFVNQVLPIFDSFTRSRSQRVSVTVANLADTVSYLAGLPGIKSLLYLSNGLETQPGSALASYASGFCPAGASELLNASASEQLSTALLELTRHANSNRVTMYSLQASGLRSPGIANARSGRRARGGGSRSAFESSRRIGERGGLSLIAAETGGRAIFSQNDHADSLAGIARDLQSYYSIAYVPPRKSSNAKRDAKAKEHRIEVRVADRALTPRYRRGYLEKDDGRWLSERIEGALNLGITSNPLEVKLGLGEIRSAQQPGSSVIPLHVMVPVERLVFLPQGDASLAELTVRAMARSLQTGVLASRSQTFRIKGSSEASGWASLVLELELGGGAHLTGLGIRDVVSGEASFVSTTIDLGTRE